MDELAMNLSTGRVDNRYLKVLIVGKTISVEMLCKDSAMRDCVSIRLELDPDFISKRNPVLHIEEIQLHRTTSLMHQSGVPALVPK
jgi:hypothetical protein